MRRNGIILEMLEAVYFLCERNVYINNDHTDEVTKHLVEILRGSTDGIGPGMYSLLISSLLCVYYKRLT